MSKSNLLGKIRGVKVESLHGAEFLPLAHHPHCDRHEHHLLWLGGRPLCLGCTCLYSGLGIGVATSVLAAPALSAPLLWLAVVSMAITPTVLQPFLQFKLFKIFARSLLGWGCGLYGVGLLWTVRLSGPRWPWVVGGIFFFLLVLKAMLLLRGRFANDPCDSCALGVFPTCSWNAERLVASLPFSSVLEKRDFGAEAAKKI